MRRPLAIIGFLYLIPALAASFFSVQIWIALASAAIVGGIGGFLLWKKYRKLILMGVLVILTSLSSFAWMWFSTYLPTTALAGKTRIVHATVVDTLPDLGRGERCLVKVDQLEDKSIDKPFLLLVTFEGTANLSIDDQFRAPADLLLTMDSAEQEYARYYMRQKIFLYGSISPCFLILEKAAPLTLSSQFKIWNHDLCLSAEAHLGKEPAQVLQAIMYGDKQGISYATSQNFRLSGLSHLTAISGLHINIIASILCASLTLFFRFLHIHRFFANGLTIVGILFYIALTGFSPSAVRAGIMVTLTQIGILIGRPTDTLNSLGFAVLVIQASNPFSVCDLGFLMSVAATLGIVVASGRISGPVLIHWHINKHRNPLHHAASYVIESIATTISATVFLLPIYVFTFHLLPITTLFTTLIAIPLLTCIVGCGGIFMLLSYFPAAAFLLSSVGSVLDFLTSQLLALVSWAAKIKYGIVPLGSDFAIAWFWVSIAIIAFVLWQKPKKIKHSFTFSVVFFILGLLLTQLYNYNSIEVTTMGANGEKSIVVACDSHATVFICQEDSNVGFKTVQYLRERGIFSIDAIYLLSPNIATIEPSVQHLIQTFSVPHVYSNFYAPLFDFPTIQPVSNQDTFSVGDHVSGSLYYGQNNKTLNVALLCSDKRLAISADFSLPDSRPVDYTYLFGKENNKTDFLRTNYVFALAPVFDPIPCREEWQVFHENYRLIIDYLGNTIVDLL